MSRFWFLILALVMIGESQVLGAPSGEVLRSSRWLIEPERGVGPVELFMTKDQVHAALGPPDEVVGDGWWYYEGDDLTIMFSLGEAETFVLGIKGGMSPTGNFSHTFQARTRDGIGIGSPRKDVIRYLGEPNWDRVDELGDEHIEFANRLYVRVRSGRVAEVQIRIPRHGKRHNPPA
jgi:hypothetical protein